ncbi:integrase, catalytic region, zinc finger, CCHC-type containing protein [Tanacetum coccineum]|uniref:Integrase, catalytic region, zinc finger, CCHC-type containing protein n=1 Tax=Tanacetum coccineum TaxID=301880 RepID=A0ABQ5G5B1_9ASTR
MGSTTTKEKAKSLNLKAKVTREQTCDNSDSQDGSDEDIDEEEDAKAFNLLAKNFRNFGNKGGESSNPKGACYNCGIEGHFASECRKSKENKAFIVGACSNSEDGDEHQNDATCLTGIESQEVCLKCDLLPDDWIMDSGCTKHMIGNRRLFTSYKEYDCEHVMFGSNLKGKVFGGGNIIHESITITNVEHASGLTFTLVSIGYSQTSKAYIVLNKETIRIEEYLNVTFDESLPMPKSSPSVEDDRINEPIVQDLNGSPPLQVNVSDEGYPKSLKEVRGLPIEQVIGELNERTLSSNVDICQVFLKLCIDEDPIWEKITYELEEPFRNTHVDECVCCQVQHIMKDNVYALRKEMREIHAAINNDLKVLTAVVEDNARVFLQD